MPSLQIHLDGDGCWPDLASLKAAGKLEWDNVPVEIALLKGGMQSGKASVAMRFNFPDGRVFICETSADLFVTAGKSIEVRASDQFKPVEIPEGWRITTSECETIVHPAGGRDLRSVPGRVDPRGR